MKRNVATNQQKCLVGYKADISENSWTERFEEFCLCKKHLAIEVRKFFARNQLLDEPVDALITDLKVTSATKLLYAIK